MRRRKEGWRTTRKAERSERRVKGKRKRKAEGEEEEGGRACGQRGARKTGGGEVWTEEEEKGEEWRERERERAHGHRKSGAFHSHAKSSDGGVCSHPGDVATKRTPLPSNHCYRQ